MNTVGQIIPLPSDMDQELLNLMVPLELLPFLPLSSMENSESWSPGHSAFY